MVFEGDACSIIEENSGELMIKVRRTDNNMFLLRFPDCGEVNVDVKKLTKAMVWHQRYSHLNHQSLRVLKMEDLVMGLPSIGQLDLCDACIFGKHARVPFSSAGTQKATEWLQHVYLYLCGPMYAELLGGNKYFFLLVDDFSTMTWIHFL